jgi:hypothetical protein
MKKPMNFGADHSKKLVALALVAGLVISFAGTAQADQGGHEDRGWHGHEQDAQNWHRHHMHHGRYVPAPRYEEEDPYVVYAPPVVVEPPSGVNIVFPIHIR